MADPLELARRLEKNLAQVVVASQETLRMALVPLLARGHLLIEDVPGVGKTTLARAMARSIHGEFRRVQFTPDLMPLDLTGASVFNQKNQDFEFKRGPVFTNILLADELNRATPRTQSALLECMEEGQVSVDGVTHTLPSVYLVLATLNPVEQAGTFELPENQLDRFMLRTRIGYPSEADEIRIFDEQAKGHPLASLEPVLELAEVEQLRHAASEIHIEASVKRYAVQLVRATRSHVETELGASPRGSLNLLRAAQALGFLEERSFVSPDVIKRIAPAVLAHRIVVRPQASLRGGSGAQVVEQVLEQVEVPVAPQAS